MNSCDTQHINKWIDQIEDAEWVEGKLAYPRYRQTMMNFANVSNISIERITAAFVALSPNNDYVGNLRSLKSCVMHVLDKRSKHVTPTVTTYKACAGRALSYLRGDVDFWTTVKGPKIKSFYLNILYPDLDDIVTVDGHMVCIWKGTDVTMKDAQVSFSLRQYKDAAKAFCLAAKEHDVLANHLQASLWFTRKRVLDIKARSNQMSFWEDKSDTWKTVWEFWEVRDFEKGK